jgi:hypothetical protein
MKHSITLFITNDRWAAKFSDPSVRRLMGCDTIMTPYSGSVSSEVVVREIGSRNPGCEIICNPFDWQTV